MRILLVNKYFYRKGGAETYFFALAEGLRALGHEVAFFSMKHSNNEPSYWSKYFVSEKDYVGDISAFKKVQEASTLIYSFEAKRKFEALLEEFKPDVIHMNNVHRQLTLSILDAPYLKRHHVPVVYTAHDYILLCPAYTMVNGRGEVCDACLDRHFMHATKNVCVKGSRAKSALATMEAEFLKFHHSYGMIDLIIAPSKFMKSKLDEGGFADKTIAMQNFLTDSQMTMGAHVANTHKFEDAQAGARPYFLFFGRLSKEKGILTLVKAFLRVAGLAKGNVGAQSDDQNAQVLPDVWDLHIVGDGPERGAIEPAGVQERGGTATRSRQRPLHRAELRMAREYAIFRFGIPSCSDPDYRCQHRRYSGAGGGRQDRLHLRIRKYRGFEGWSAQGRRGRRGRIWHHAAAVF